MEPGKKISFGFSKTSKKPSTLNKPEEKQIDFVESLEGQSIKLKNELEVVEKQPLVIPLKDNKKDLLDRVRDMKTRKKTNAENSVVEDTRPDSELTEDELAAREVLRDAKLRIAEGFSADNKILVLPIKTEDLLPLEGEKESTLDDYENVPVNDFGLAMLRGMGWKEGVSIGKNPTKASLVNKQPELRPKGLGLGANALASSETSAKSSLGKNGETLILKKGSYAKIIAGNQKGNYCEVQGLDDEAGRVIVKTTIKNEVLALNEFMLIAVAKEEYSRNSKVLNTAKFEEYKKIQAQIKSEIKEEKDENYKSHREDKFKTENGKIKKEKCNDKSVTEYKDQKIERKDHLSYEKETKRYSRKNKSDQSPKHSKKYTDDSSDSDSDYEKSRKTHKRKDKKRHRDKSRSPIYKSHRKSSKNKHKYSSSDSEHEHHYKSSNRIDSDNRYGRRIK